MKRLGYFLLVVIFLCASCAKDQWFDPPGLLPGNNSLFNLICPQIKIAVASDIHYMDPSIAPDDPENNPGWQTWYRTIARFLNLAIPFSGK